MTTPCVNGTCILPAECRYHGKDVLSSKFMCTAEKTEPNVLATKNELYYSFIDHLPIVYGCIGLLTVGGILLLISKKRNRKVDYSVKKSGESTKN